MIKQASCILFLNPDVSNEILVVSRRHDVNDSTVNVMWGLPGGKVDTGESSSQAASREAEEETDIFIDHNMLIPIYSGLSYGKTNFWVTTYLYPDTEYNEPKQMESGIILDYMNINELANQNICPFYLYNSNMLNQLTQYENT